MKKIQAHSEAYKDSKTNNYNVNDSRIIKASNQLTTGSNIKNKFIKISKRKKHKPKEEKKKNKN